MTDNFQIHPYFDDIKRNGAIETKNKPVYTNYQMKITEVYIRECEMAIRGRSRKKLQITYKIQITSALKGYLHISYLLCDHQIFKRAKHDIAYRWISPLRTAS